MDVNSWHMVPEILSRISEPTFRNVDYIVTNYGAVGDEVTDNTDAFRSAIEACNSAGGGRVVVPAVSIFNFRLFGTSNISTFETFGTGNIFDRCHQTVEQCQSSFDGRINRLIHS